MLPAPRLPLLVVDGSRSPASNPVTGLLNVTWKRTCAALVGSASRRVIDCTTGTARLMVYFSPAVKLPSPLGGPPRGVAVEAVIEVLSPTDSSQGAGPGPRGAVAGAGV